MVNITLFVKAGADGQRYGACPFCHRLFMLLLVKAKHRPELRFRVVTVNLAKPPEIFRQNTLTRVPALIDCQVVDDCHTDAAGDTVAVDTVDDIIEHLDTRYPTPELMYANEEVADSACNRLFQKFCFYIKDMATGADSTGLTGELHKLDDYLGQQKQNNSSTAGGGTYLCGTRLTSLDIEMWPKLHHIRVAAGYLKDYVIPARFAHVWSYMGEGYKQRAFVDSCPADQEIIFHWADRPETPNLTAEQNAQLAKQEPRYSIDIPN
ncbi:chloride intracellular channel exl-1-like [Oppia nitens]|uniref:chloride intracellular channel exl-1-like n=1 Tax=Oppia nitens TaxID=1686743 RepID=UPI0023DAC18C|nr:chloride intracellular channel exl-1-like [Oppia nitens]